MLYLLIGVGICMLVWISFLAVEHLQGEEDPEWSQLRRQQEEVRTSLEAFLADRKGEDPASATPAINHAEGIEVLGLIHAGKAEEAVALAEQAMAREGQNPETRLILAAALHACGDLVPAEAQLKMAEDLGAGGGWVDYLGTRIEIEQYLRGAGAKTVDTTLNPVEVLALELIGRLGETGDVSAMWLPGEGGEVSKEEARSFVIAHFSGYYRLLQTMIHSMQVREYSDGLYLVGLLAIKCGFAEPGAKLLLSIGDAMSKSAEHKNYLRSLALLRGEKPVAKEETTKGGKTLVKLKVLN